MSFRTAAATAITLAIASSAYAQSRWALSGGGVWLRTPAGLVRIAYNPTNGNIGNMGAAGVNYSSNAPGAVQGGAAAGNTAVGTAFSRWDALKAIPTVRINLKSVAPAAGVNLPVTWAANIGPPGSTENAAVNANPRPIKLNTGNAGTNLVRTLRTDGYTIDKAGTGAQRIDEFDVYSTAVHEAGHGIGLGHPGLATQVMTDQVTSRGTAGGLFKVKERPTPFAGQPTDLGGAALPNGALTYLDPRASLGLWDAIGAATLYSAPISSIASFFTAGGGQGGANRFAYSLFNDSGIDVASGLRTGYLARRAFIPVADSASAFNLQAPTGWSISRLTGGVAVEWLGSEDGLLPGSSIDFSFDSDETPSLALPGVRWRIDGLGPDAGDPDGEGDPGMTPGFDVSDFGVLDDTYTYQFDTSADDWRLIRMDAVVTPVPEPATLLVLGLGALALRRRRK